MRALVTVGLATAFGAGCADHHDTAGTCAVLVEAGARPSPEVTAPPTRIYLSRDGATLSHGRDDAALEQRVARLRENPDLRPVPLHDLLAMLRRERNSITGRAEDVIPQIQAYANAGVEELMLQILDSDDIQGLNSFAEQVMPHVSGK